MEPRSIRPLHEKMIEADKTIIEALMHFIFGLGLDQRGLRVAKDSRDHFESIGLLPTGQMNLAWMEKKPDKHGAD